MPVGIAQRPGGTRRRPLLREMRTAVKRAVSSQRSRIGIGGVWDMVVFDILSKKKIVPGVTRMDASRDPRPLMDGDIVERPINGKSILGLVNEGIIVPMFTRTELGHVGWERITAEELMKLSHADLALKSTDSSVMNKISANTHRRGIVISKGKPAVRVGKRTISISDKGVVTKIENPALAKKLIAPSLRIFRKAWQTTSPKKY